MKRLNSKILRISDISKIIENKKKNGKIVCLCHGVFDLLHIGHIKYLKEAKKICDFLVVSVTSDKFVRKGINRPYFNEKLRAESLAGLEVVDCVCISENLHAVKIIKSLRPNIYFKGSDYKDHSKDISLNIILEAKAIKSVKGRIMYSKSPMFSSSTLINKFTDILSNEKKTYLEKFEKNINFDLGLKYINKIFNLKILVIGETIVDEYVFLDTLGKSGKEHYLATKKVYKDRFLGGAAAIANHLSSFCNKVNFYSIIGEKKEYLDFIKKKISKNIKAEFFLKKKSPTILKTRYLDRDSKLKLFGVYDLNDQIIDQKTEKLIIKSLSKNLKKFDLVIVADYGHGFLTKKISDLIFKKSKFTALNSQLNSSNVGFHTLSKYSKANLLIINEGELRHELRNRVDDINKILADFSKKSNFDKIIVTRGNLGSLLVNKKNMKNLSCPAFTSQVLDKVGAGDTMLAITAPLVKLGCPEQLVMLLGNLAGAFSVENLANSKFVNKIDFIKNYETILK
jgi:rfaE bifunctional protein kinase chain/domain/rfaE bifunctional protein nucleotidyltransferase chain/domain